MKCLENCFRFINRTSTRNGLDNFVFLSLIQRGIVLEEPICIYDEINKAIFKAEYFNDEDYTDFIIPTFYDDEVCKGKIKEIYQDDLDVTISISEIWRGGNANYATAFAFIIDNIQLDDEPWVCKGFQWKKACGVSSCSWSAIFHDGIEAKTVMELNHSDCAIISETQAECLVSTEQTNWDPQKSSCPRYMHPFDTVLITLNKEGYSKETIMLGNIPSGCKI